MANTNVIFWLGAIILVTGFWLINNDIRVDFDDLTELDTLLIKNNLAKEHNEDLDLEKLAIEKGIIEETPLIRAGREYRNK